MSGSWSVVVPVKPTSSGKSRLDDGRTSRPALALAIALDTIQATARAERVADIVVVTSDSEVIAGLASIDKARSLPDPGMGLNGAVRAGLAVAEQPSRAAMLGDLPALSPDDLDAALADADQFPRSFVPDVEGTGTTLAMWRSGTPAEPRFGPGSAAQHRIGAFTPLLARPSLRRDVDTPEQLAVAAELGLGPRTAALLRALRAA